ncbi:MAG: NAD(P)-dependent oxidoreductase [Chloroflexi bacterium]|nr:NAD(P)-dependent oxidoreductase [Chloroflexota bacterium]
MGDRRIAIVTGGSGYIGGFLISELLGSGGFEEIINFDLVERDFGSHRVTFRRVDVRQPIAERVERVDGDRSWIFHLAALAREPGSERREYFDTNVGGAETVTAYAAETGIRNLFFTSSMSTFGRMEDPTPEAASQYPETPYGISKLVAEKIHETWLAADPNRRLIVCRPAVIFGPGDRENVPRMVGAVKRGYFVFPGDPSIIKAYGYVYGLMDSIRFVLQRPERHIVFHYAEENCLPLRSMVAAIMTVTGKKARIVRLPQRPLLMLAQVMSYVSGRLGRRTPVHPVRVRKVAFPTNLKPQYLIDAGFEFRYPFEVALEHWKERDPDLFA